MPRLMPAPDGGDDFVGIGGPGEGFGLLVGFPQKAVNSGLQLDNRAEDTALESLPRQPGEEALDGVEPGTRRRGVVEDETRMTVEPGADLGMLVSTVIVEDRVDDLAGRQLALDGVEETNE